MSSIYNNPGAAINNPLYNPTRQVVIPQITIPSGLSVQQNFEPLIAHGKEAAKAMHIPPGVRVPIFDDTEECFYYKETDVNGNIVAFDTYDYAKRVEAPPPQYLTVEKFEAFVADFNKFKEDYQHGQSIRTQEYPAGSAAEDSSK